MIAQVRGHIQQDGQRSLHFHDFNVGPPQPQKALGEKRVLLAERLTCKMIKNGRK